LAINCGTFSLVNISLHHSTFFVLRVVQSQLPLVLAAKEIIKAKVIQPKGMMTAIPPSAAKISHVNPSSLLQLSQLHTFKVPET
jgi:hypothetical protein